VLKALESLGFVVVRQRGSHVFLRHADGRSTVVPIHSREDIGRGLLRKIIRDAQVEVEEFLEFV
jgi:predicted RNA binding protein YcfA (HicA-like mRNA interferase family)